jgi:hypothetical protein
MEMAALTTDGWIALGTWATVAVLAVTAVLAAQQVREQLRPWVTVDFHFRSIVAFIAVRNLGNRAAYDIRIRFEPPLVSAYLDQDALGEVAMFRDPIPILVPNEERFALFDRTPDRLKAEHLPVQHRVVVEYKDRRGKKLGPDEFVLDFAHLMGGTLPDKNMHDLVEAVRALQK